MNKIDKLRKLKCMSYEEIAINAGLTASYICLLAKEKRTNPSLEAMRKIASALEEKVDRVFKIN